MLGGDILLALATIGNHEKIGAIGSREKKKFFICGGHLVSEGT